MIDRMRRLIPQKMRTRIKEALGIPATRLHPDWAVLRLIGPVSSKHVLLDVGAHHGWFFHCWQDWCPLAEVYAFEPTSESFEKMQALYGSDQRVHLAQIGIGSKKTKLSFNVLADSQVSNSFLAPKQDTWEAIQYRTGEVSHRILPITTLDNYCSENGISQTYLLKIDVQGFELEVLKGATKTLMRADYVFVESGIQKLYDGAASFAEVCDYMGKAGFHLIHLRSWHRGNRSLIEADLIFRRNDLAPPIDNSRDRFYVELR